MNGFEKNIAAITGRTSSTEVYEISQQMYAYGLGSANSLLHHLSSGLSVANVNLLLLPLLLKEK